MSPHLLFVPTTISLVVYEISAIQKPCDHEDLSAIAILLGHLMNISAHSSEGVLEYHQFIEIEVD